ncbi:MAG: type II toxin-antitoxin system VapC family toxin [Pirellulales bacterium]
MILVDVNVLLYAHREESVRHREYRRWLETAIEGPEPCAVSELVLSGCLRVLTHPRVFDPPTPLARAVEYVAWIKEHERMTVLAPGQRHWGIFLDLCHRADARGNLVSDAYHAALAVETGATLITTDRDYARFPGLRYRHPLGG